MGYSGGSLVSLFDGDAQAATRVMLRALAERAGDRMTELTVMNSPIRHGNLRSSWYQLPVQRTHFGPWPAYETGTASDVDYAPHVEYGTGLWGPKGAKYPIEPKKPGGFLKFMVNGQEVFAKRVMHPGIRGQHMLAIAADVTEAEFDKGVLGRGVIGDWVAKVEAGAD